MFRIKNKIVIGPDLKRLDIDAPDIARRARAGQFVSLAPEDNDERIPLFVVEANRRSGQITLIIEEIGTTTKKLGSMGVGEEIFSILGPLGVPSQIEKFGTVLCVSSGIGTAAMLPVTRALRDAGNKVVGIVGAKTKRRLLLESQMRLCCQRIFVTTDDGSYERRGQATDVVKSFIEDNPVERVYAIGSVAMMEQISRLTAVKNIPTRVVLTPVMVDGMGLCGSCRVKVGTDTVLACINGPEFDGHHVDYQDLNIRMNAYEAKETWHNRQQSSNPTTSEPKTFRKFLSDILNG